MSLRRISDPKGDPTKSVVLLNFDDLMDSLIKINGKLISQGVAAMGIVGGVMATQVQDKTPVRLGNLRGAIKEDRPKIKGDIISVEVTSGGVEYAEVIEFGYEDARKVSYNVEGFADVVSTEGARMFTKTIDSRKDNLVLQEVLIDNLKL